VTPDATAGTAAPSGRHPVPAHPSQGIAVRSGAELVALSERFYGGVFAGAVVFVGLAALAALVVMPARDFRAGAPVALAFAATALIAAGAAFAAWRAGAVYRGLRRRPQLQLALVVVAGALIASPALTSQLWWPSCAILMALALVVPVRRALLYCLLVLGTNLAGHLVAADFDDIHPVDIIGLWIGIPLWIMVVAIVTDRLSAFILRLDVTPPLAETRREHPCPVPVSTSEPSPSPAPASAVEVVPAPGAEQPEADPPATPSERLTARQLQVVALLADGLRHREVAACLSISERQVQRHVAEAVARLGLRNAYELAAFAVAEGLVPGAAAPAARA
jgi:DNA-binding CsgD family transcriptional regulator